MEKHYLSLSTSSQTRKDKRRYRCEIEVSRETLLAISTLVDPTWEMLDFIKSSVVRFQVTSGAKKGSLGDIVLRYPRRSFDIRKR